MIALGNQQRTARHRQKCALLVRIRRALASRVSYGIGLIGSFALGASGVITDGFDDATEGEKAAYLVASWKIVHPERLESIGEALDPLAKDAGYTPLAATRPEVLEGSWPYDGILIVQRYRSMRALQKFWYSAAHNEAKKVREGHVDSAFVVAVEAIE